MWGVNGRFGLDWTGSRDSGNEAVSLMMDNEECGHCQTWRGMKKRDKVEGKDHLLYCGDLRPEIGGQGRCCDWSDIYCSAIRAWAGPARRKGCARSR